MRRMKRIKTNLNARANKANKAYEEAKNYKILTLILNAQDQVYYICMSSSKPENFHF